MKHLFCFLFAATCFHTKLYCQTPAASYPFDNNANDAIGAANGTGNAVTLAPERRYSNLNQTFRCYQFNGTSSFITLGDNPVHKPVAALTVSLWFRLDNTAGSPNGGVLISNTECTMGYEIWWNKPGQTIVAQVGRNGGYAIINTPDADYLSGWHHVAMTYDGRYTKLYLDGKLKGTDDAGAVYPVTYCSNISTIIGAEAGPSNTIDPNYYWSGKIDEVRIYHTALTEDQVRNQSGFLPGSGKALQINTVASPQYYAYTGAVNGINDFAANQDFTIDFWFKAPVAQANTSTIINSMINNTNGNRWNYEISIINPPHADAGKVSIQRWDGTNNPYVYSTTTVNDNKWHHCAFVRSGGAAGSIALYIDGNLQGTVADNTGNSTTGYFSYVGGRGDLGIGNFTGELDEVRFWNTGLTAAQLRNRMCRKITGSDALWNNLTHYLRFDEAIVNPAPNETILNYAAYEGVYTHWQSPTVPYTTSGAPIGNNSVADYSSTPSAVLTLPSGESFTASASAGSPAGIHVYSVDEAPDNLTGATGSAGNKHYFGVYVSGGTSPQYTATYNYTGNPFVNLTNEPLLILNKRDNNAAASWSNSGATLNTTANTLTATGQNTEYIPGLSSGTLPVTLTLFTAVKQGEDVLLQWQTASEQNSLGFAVQHSTNGINFNSIGFVHAVGNSTSVNNYSFTHPQPAKGKNFYRLLLKDRDGRSATSKINRVLFDENSSISIYPNPVRNDIQVQLTLPVREISLLDMNGKIVWLQQNASAGNYMIPLHTYPAGVLVLQVTDQQNKKTAYRIVKH